MDMSSIQKNWKDRACFVEQQDALLPTNTAREVLEFSARLRLGKDCNEAKELATNMLKQLELTKCQDVYVGDGLFIKGLSGGERKRVSIGRELICDPGFIVLDEPISGLDSYMALEVIRILKKLCQKGKTVITTMHQPSSEIVAEIDSFIVMYDGGIIFQGGKEGLGDFLAEVGYPVPKNILPTDYVLTLLMTIDVSKIQWNSLQKQSFQPIPKTIQLEAETKRKSTAFTQFLALGSRSLRIGLRHPAFFFGYISDVFVSALLGMFFWDYGNKSVESHVTAISWMCSIMQFNCVVLVMMPLIAMKGVILKEVSSGTYDLCPWYCATILQSFVDGVIHAILTLSIMYPMCSFSGSFEWLLDVLVIGAWVATAWGAVVAALSPDMIIANMAVPLIINPQLFCSMSQSLPSWLEWYEYATFMAPTNRLAVDVEFKTNDEANWTKYTYTLLAHWIVMTCVAFFVLKSKSRICYK